MDIGESDKGLAAEPATEAAWPPGVAAAVTRLGLGSCARLLLESLRPVSWLGAQMLWLAQPTAALFGWGTGTARLAQTLESEAGVTALIAALDPPATKEPR